MSNFSLLNKGRDRRGVGNFSSDNPQQQKLSHYSFLRSNAGSIFCAKIQYMKTILLLLACLSLFTLASAVDEAPPQRKEIGNLVIEGVPDIPPELAERIHQYENTRAADFQGWHPDGNGILILTRFGNTDQVHSVSGPGSDRRQLTFF